MIQGDAPLQPFNDEHEGYMALVLSIKFLVDFIVRDVPSEVIGAFTLFILESLKILFQVLRFTNKLALFFSILV